MCDLDKLRKRLRQTLLTSDLHVQEFEERAGLKPKQAENFLSGLIQGKRPSGIETVSKIETQLARMASEAYLGLLSQDDRITMIKLLPVELIKKLFPTL